MYTWRTLRRYRHPQEAMAPHSPHPLSPPNGEGENEQLSQSTYNGESDEGDAVDQQPQHAILPSAPHTIITRARSDIIKLNPKYALFTVKSGYLMPNSVKAALNKKGGMEQRMLKSKK